jgi:2,4-dienoyl-CoA reductase (NADPH2)
MGVPRNGAQISAASPKSVDFGSGGLPEHLYVPGGRVTPLPQEATVQEIEDLQSAVAESARRAKAVGFDGVEIAAHMCYFYSSFLSPLANKRTDAYGGSAENRARALRDVVVAVRAEVGPDFPVGIRMSVNDHMPGGQDTDGFAEVAGHIVQAGVDFISLTEGNYESMREYVPSESGTCSRTVSRRRSVPRSATASACSCPVRLTRSRLPGRSPLGKRMRRCSHGKCSRTRTTP